MWCGVLGCVGPDVAWPAPYIIGMMTLSPFRSPSFHLNCIFFAITERTLANYAYLTYRLDACPCRDQDKRQWGFEVQEVSTEGHAKSQHQTANRESALSSSLALPAGN